MSEGPSRIQRILKTVGGEMGEVEREISGALEGVKEPLESVLRLSMEGGGRLRPGIALLAGRMLDSPMGSTVSMAAAFELVHTATLIHDDILDRSPLRRGRQTHHTVWPLNATVLAGDYLLSRSVSMLSALGDPRLLRLVGDTFCSMVSGEIREIFPNPLDNIGISDYYEIIEAKTGSLFAAVAEGPGMLAERSAGDLSSLRDYGIQFGIALQIMDDVLDFASLAPDRGKPKGSDFRQGVVTMPSLIYMEMGGDDMLLARALQKGAGEDLVEEARGEIIDSGAIEVSVKRAVDHCRSAQSALGPLPDNEYRGLLRELVGLVAETELGPYGDRAGAGRRSQAKLKA